MTAPTPADQAAAAVIVAEWTAGSQQTSDLREAIAQAMADERKRGHEAGYADGYDAAAQVYIDFQNEGHW